MYAIKSGRAAKILVTPPQPQMCSAYLYDAVILFKLNYKKCIAIPN